MQDDWAYDGLRTHGLLAGSTAIVSATVWRRSTGRKSRLSASSSPLPLLPELDEGTCGEGTDAGAFIEPETVKQAS